MTLDKLEEMTDNGFGERKQGKFKREFLPAFFHNLPWFIFVDYR